MLNKNLIVISVTEYAYCSEKLLTRLFGRHMYGIGVGSIGSLKCQSDYRYFNAIGDLFQR